MKIVFIGFAIFLNLPISAQNYLISFAGKGASSVVNNVKVENLTSGESLTLHKGEMLRLIGIVGISPLDENKYSLFIYPNPMTSNDAVLRIFPPDAGNALITIYSITGKIEAQSQYYLDAYPQEYRLSGLKNGLHLINISGKTYHYSGKLICSGNAEGTIRIDALNSRYPTDANAPEIDEKRSEFIVNMRYTYGDRLKFTGISENYSTVKTDIPVEDKTITFNFFPCSDKDNNNYSVVEIASQVWMAENLRTTVYDNGQPIEFSDSRTGIAENQTNGTYSWYGNNKPENEGLYGALYNWYAVSSGNLCPAGWRIPDRNDWLTLEGNLGGASIAGTKIKETGAYWTPDNNISTNESGFSALPGGYRVGHVFTGINHYAYLWGSDPQSNIKGSTAWYINSNSEYLVESGIFSINDGLSVRCILGESSVTLPEVFTSEINNVSTDKASGGGFVKSFGGAYLTAQGVCWSISEDPTTDNNKTIDDADDPNFTSILTGLQPGTTYHVRAYSTNFAGTAYGADKTFTTATSIPILTTASANNITRTTASSGGSIISNGGSTVTINGICWSTTSNPTISGPHTTDGIGVSFTGKMTGLTANTEYFVRAYATNSSGTGYGNAVIFTTRPKEIPTLTTTEVSAVTSTRATSGGNITDDGGSPVTARGICLSTASNPTIADNKTLNGTGSGSFISNLTELEPGTVYHIRAYATNSTGTAYGAELTFTPPPVIPSLSTTVVSAITRTTALSGGNISANGGATVTVSGICWSTSHNPTIADSKISNGYALGGYISSMEDLTPGTVYYVRAFAANSAGTGYGNEVSFTTNPPLRIPALTTTSVTSVTSSEATSGGNITDDGGSPVTVRGICMSISPNPTIADDITSNGTGTGSFTSYLTGLEPGTVYYVRAYATNIIGTAYGAELTFTATPLLPILNTTAVSEITRTTAASGGNITSDGGAAVTASGICWSTSNNPSITGSHTTGTETGSFINSMTGLAPGTLYYVRAYAVNSSGTSYGNEVSFTTNPIALSTVMTSSVTSITLTSAISGGNITDNGGGNITDRGVCWSFASNPTISDDKTSNGTGTGSFTSSLTGLQPGTTYHLRAYSTNSAGTAYGADINFTTLVSIPVMSTSAANNITRTGARSGGTITSNGGAAIIVSGICWGTSSNPTTAGAHTTDGTTSGSFTGSMTGLEINTVYYVRSYATNSVGTGYGNVISFRTLSLSVATITTNTVTSITSSTAESGGNITDDGGATITGRGICWGLTSNPTILNFRLAKGTGTGSFTGTMTQLQPEVTYYVRAYATNSQGTAYGAQLSFTSGADPNTDVTFQRSADGSILLHAVGDKSIILKTVGSDRYIQYSSNNGVSYNSGVKVTGIFSYYNKARILENGTIVLFSVSRIYYSDDNMSTINPCIVLDKSGNPFTLHNPSNPGYPGGYFNFMGGFAENDGVAVMGNYANSSFGASPVNLYYSLDGITWKVFYSFGQNPDYTDNGTAMGGTGGTLLGDPGNPLLTRHVHAVNVGGDGNFYACTGDDNQELHFMKCNYSKASDTWAVNDLLSGVTRDWQRMRALGVYEKDGYLYWGSDGPDIFTYRGIQYDSFGIYKCAIADVNDPSKHILLQPLTDACYSFVNTGSLVFAGLQSYGYIYISYDYGETWSHYAKPVWMDGTVQGIWFNDLYRYFETNDGVKIESSLF